MVGYPELSALALELVVVKLVLLEQEEFPEIHYFGVVRSQA